MVVLIVSIIVGILLLLFIAAILIVEISYHKTYYHRGDGDIRIRYVTHYDDLESKPISFLNKKKAVLNGFLYSKPGLKDYKALLVVVHGIGAGHYYLLPLIKKFAYEGYLVLCYDQYASGLSEGKYITSMVRGVSDLECALNFVKSDESLKDMPLYLFGHSWGGYCVLNSLNIKDHNIKKIISVAGFNNDNDIATSIYKKAKILSWAIYLRNLVRFKKAAFYSSVKSLKKNQTTKVLYIQGTEDNVVLPPYSGLRYKEISKENNSLRVEMIEGKGHAPYVTNVAQKEQNVVMAELGLFGKTLNNYDMNIDYEKLSDIDPKVYSLMIDFYNN